MSVTVPGSAGHVPDQPSWMCGTCGNDWPCESARERLAVEYRSDPVALATYMGVQLGLAAFELGAAVTSLELYDRFVEWPLRVRVPLDRT